MGDLTRFDEGVVLHVVDLQEFGLHRIDVYVSGSKMISHTVKGEDVGPTTLNALASGFGVASLSVSAVNGALVWSRANMPTKQEAGHIKRAMLFFWGIVRAFLP